jgi:predicted RNase H-like HicB family nuclease
MTVARKSKHVRYTVILQEETDPDFAGYYNAIVPALPGCFSYGASREEALANVKEAIQPYLEDLEASGEPIPVEHIEQIGIEV